MITITDKKRCCGCHACVQACPVQCIRMESDDEGFLYPAVEASRCISCGYCEKVCPVLHPCQEAGYAPHAWAVINTDENIRLQSSSGGVFSLLAEHILSRGGVVFGAAFNERFEVEHIAVDDVEELGRLRGSKYTQSQIGGTFQKAKDYLSAGRQVLFSGTPCQIEGLKVFLGKEYSNLLLVDIICHGVPSPRVWQKYVQFREEKNKTATRRIFFRHKKYGWKRYSVSFKFLNDTEYLAPLEQDLFMQAFLTDCCLRPSCGSCSFKKLKRASDITLADFWGIERILPSMDDNKGTSLVLAHSEAGRNALSQILGRCRKVSVDTNIALRGNPAMTHSPVFHKNRTIFFEKLDILPFDELVRKYAVRPFSLKSCVAGVLRKVGLLELVKAILRRR